MRKRLMLAVSIVGLFVLGQDVRAESPHRFGVGVNYWIMLDDVDVHNIDENGVSWLLTYQYKCAPLLKWELDLEMFPDGYQGIAGSTYAPETYLVLGSGIYGAVGVGILYTDGEFADTAFYALRAGIDLEVVPQFYLDLNVNYRSSDWSDLSVEKFKDIDADTVTLGAALRVEF